MGQFFGEDLRARAYVEASDTIRLSLRAGLGKARKMDTAELCVQDAFERQEFVVDNIGSEHNFADVAKPMPSDIMKRHLESLGCWAVPLDAHPEMDRVRVCVCVCSCMHMPMCVPQPRHHTLCSIRIAALCGKYGQAICRLGPSAHRRTTCSQKNLDNIYMYMYIYTCTLYIYSNKEIKTERGRGTERERARDTNKNKQSC